METITNYDSAVRYWADGKRHDTPDLNQMTTDGYNLYYQDVLIGVKTARNERCLLTLVDGLVDLSKLAHKIAQVVAHPYNYPLVPHSFLTNRTFPPDILRRCHYLDLTHLPDPALWADPDEDMDW